MAACPLTPGHVAILTAERMALLPHIALKEQVTGGKTIFLCLQSSMLESAWTLSLVFDTTTADSLCTSIWARCRLPSDEAWQPLANGSFLNVFLAPSIALRETAAS